MQKSDGKWRTRPFSLQGKEKETQISAATVKMTYAIGESCWKMVQSVIEEHMDNGLWNRREKQTGENSELLCKYVFVFGNSP